jgi:lipopolysaccharide transport system permease protein
LQGKLPDLAGLALYTAVALVVAWAGYIWFCLTKHGFSDVV